MTANPAATVRLAAVPHAAASDGRRVWCLAGDRLLGYAPGGEPFLGTDVPPAVTGLVAVGDALVATGEDGAVTWLDPDGGREVARRQVAAALVVAGGPSGACVVDRAAGRAWVVDGLRLDGPFDVPAVDRAVVVGGRVWFTARDDTLLRADAAVIDLGVGPEARGDVVVGAGSVWVSVPDALLRVGTWSPELGLPVAVPEGPVAHLAAEGGRLVGASGRHGLWVLDVAADAEARHLDVDVGGELAHLVATNEAAWAFPAGEAVAHVVAL